MGLPLFRKEIKGKPRNTGKTYQPDEKDEVEDLFYLLKTVKQHYNDVEGVSSRDCSYLSFSLGVSVGAIESTYQKTRVENVCKRLGLTPLCYLWEKDQTELYDGMIRAGVDAIVIKVASAGLTSKHLGMTLKEVSNSCLRL